MNAKAVEAPMPKLARPMSDMEAGYMRQGKAPLTSSHLTSSSKFLNSPLFRDAWAQQALRRFGTDLPATYSLPEVFRAIYDVTDLKEYVGLVAREKELNPEFGEWVNARKLVYYRPEELKDYAPGTLGASIHDFLTKSGMQMEFMATGSDVDNDLDFILKRRGHTHDIEHMVSGFGPNNLGEHALALFNNVAIAQYFSPELAHHLTIGMAFITTASLMRNSLNYPAAMPHAFEATRLAIEAGQRLKKPLFMVDWNSYLDRQLADVATDLGFERADADHWESLNHLTED